MAIFGRAGIDIDPSAIQLLEQLQATTNDPGVQNIVGRIGSGEFGAGPLSMQDVIGIGRRLLPGQSIPAHATLHSDRPVPPPWHSTALHSTT